MKRYELKKDENEELYLVSVGASDETKLQVSTLIQEGGNKKIFAFEGEMGAGKTTLIKQLCQELKVTDIVNSPTFAIVNVYESDIVGEIYHFDCYRLKNISEAIDLGAEDYIYSGNLCFIEWPNIIEDLLPENTIYIRITIEENGRRILEVSD